MNLRSRKSGKAAYPILSIGAVLVCTAIVFAQSGSGQDNGLQLRVAALEAALANLQNPPAKVFIAGDPDGTDGTVDYIPSVVETNTMADCISVDNTTGDITILRAGAYRLGFKANRNTLNGVGYVVVNGQFIDVEFGFVPTGALGTTNGRLVQLAAGDVVEFKGDSVQACGPFLLSSRVEIQYLGQ